MRRLDAEPDIAEPKRAPAHERVRSYAHAPAARPGRLVMVSNRVAAASRDAQPGGLAVAIADCFHETEGVWFGWSGQINDNPGDEKPVRKAFGRADIATLDLRQSEYDGYYSGFANECLWPILHYRADLVKFDQTRLDGYRGVCRRFASALRDLITPGDYVWVHDFHLLGLGAELRRLGVEAPMGLFLHVPFPPPEVLSALPKHRQVFGDLFAYDLVGFQTKADLSCFRRYARDILGARTDGDDRLSRGRETVVARTFPIGIDVDAFASLALDASGRRVAARIKAADGDCALIIGVDRLDYTKGLPERFAAYRRFLETYPEERRRTLFLQVTPPTRAHLEPYARIQNELDALEGAIHGAFADVDWSPIRYIKRQAPRRRLVALYRAARIGLVTPLRDGMNLVAKEFVAAQDESDPGVLVLSAFAGAAETLTDALTVNPYDIDEVADAIRQGLTMPLDERKARHAKLLASVRRHDVHAWRRGFIHALTSARQSVYGARMDAAAPTRGLSKAEAKAVEAS